MTQRGLVLQKDANFVTQVKALRRAYLHRGRIKPGDICTHNKSDYIESPARATVCSETTRAKREMRRASYQGRYPSAHIIASSMLTRFQAITPVKRGGVFGAGMPGRNYVPCYAPMMMTPDHARGKRGNILQTNNQESWRFNDKLHPICVNYSVNL